MNALKILAIIGLSLIIASCSSAAQVSSTDTAVPSNTSAPQIVVAPTNTIRPTRQQPTPWPSNTLAPTKPTRTKGPTLTPRATNTPSPTIGPVILSGTGDSVVDTNWKFPALLHIIYTGGGNFAIKTYDSNGEYLDLLVNTIGAYEGTVPMNLRANEIAERFQVIASGTWEIQILPITSMRIQTVPGVITGNGDDVVLLDGNSDLLKIDASTAKGNFAIRSYSPGNLFDIDLLVNEIAPYTGTVIVPKFTIFIEIIAEGPWSIEVTAR